jgi:hypothetical protein
MIAYVIRDRDGYWCGMRRNPDKSPVHFFSTKRKDAVELHFYEAAQRFAALLPQPVRIVRVTASE